MVSRFAEKIRDFNAFCCSERGKYVYHLEVCNFRMYALGTGLACGGVSLMLDSVLCKSLWFCG